MQAGSKLECWISAAKAANDTDCRSKAGCKIIWSKKVTIIDSSRFDTSRVTGMNSMFADCCSLESLDLSGFDTRNVSVFREMFCNWSSLKRLDLSSFDTSLANQIQSCEMFCKCPSLQEINLSKDFFKGDMSLSYRPTPKRIWVNANNQSSIKSWEEMNQTWNDGDAGWWIIIHNTALLESI